MTVRWKALLALLERDQDESDSRFHEPIILLNVNTSVWRMARYLN